MVSRKNLGSWQPLYVHVEYCMTYLLFRLLRRAEPQQVRIHGAHAKPLTLTIPGTSSRRALPQAGWNLYGDTCEGWL